MSNIIHCAQIVTYNLTPTIINWELDTLDKSRIYKSGDDYLEFDTFSLHLKDLYLEPGVKLLLKASRGGLGDEPYASETLEYQPDSDNTVYYYLIEDENDKKIIKLIDIVSSSESPPILKCSSIYSFNNLLVLNVNYVLSTIEEGEIYGTCFYAPAEAWNYNLGKLGRPVGTQLKLEAKVYAGSDSKAYLMLEYDPTSDYIAYFILAGDMFKTILFYNAAPIEC